MDKTSSLVTGGLTGSAAALVPVVQFALTTAGLNPPIDVTVALVALVMTGSHALYNLASLKLAKPAQPQERINP